MSIVVAGAVPGAKVLAMRSAGLDPASRRRLQAVYAARLADLSRSASALPLLPPHDARP